MKHVWMLPVLLSLCLTGLQAQNRMRMAESPSVSAGNGGSMNYTRDQRGNQIPDFSYCGYMASDREIPQAPVKAVVALVKGDATEAIQAALDYVGSLPADEQGIRGAVLLEKGRYEVSGRLLIRHSGVVLRGSGCLEGETEILATNADRTNLIRMAGRLDNKAGTMLALSAPAPTGTMEISAAGHQFKTGDRIRVIREGTAQWIDEMDMNDFGGESNYIGWKVKDATRLGDINTRWERSVVSVAGDKLTLDAPLTCEIRPGEGFVQSFETPGRITQSGVENLRLTSTYDQSNPKDENHCWNAIEIDNVEDAWVRRVEFRHFAGSAVFITDNSRRITVEDAKSFAPVSEIGGQRRNTFFTLGGQCLFLRLYSEQGMHDFGVGRCLAGPVAFVQCVAKDSWHFSGTIDSWATGVLLDACTSEGNAFSFANRGQDGMGAGWTAGNCVMWNCSADLLAAPTPPTAYNWAFGSWGQTVGTATWRSSDSFVKPLSLYYAQLAARHSQLADKDALLMPVDTQSASNPPVDKAQEFVAEARRPALQLTEWIDTLMLRAPLSTAVPAKSMYKVWQPKKSKSKSAAPKMHMEHGVLVRDGKILTGGSQDIIWWNGSLKDRFLSTGARPHITRWVPGRTGVGYTDDLDEMTDRMLQRHTLITDHNYGLWYDRRRDDHERIRRMDGYVWAPFYEQPFGRSGESSAWDGLSRYDLTRWNNWYWNRLRTYADLADEKGLVLYHQNYFQHNILEAGAHWADSPWRSANNVNETGFPEPVPYAQDKRIYMADQFYDISHPQRRALHRNYIRKCLDNFVGNGSVIQFISAEFTGPLHFVEFWLDVIAEWEAETGQNALVALSTTKDVTDAILKDPKRAAAVDILDIRYWRPTANGFSAPPGGVNMAPRQMGRVAAHPSEAGHNSGQFKGRTMEERVYETISDFRQQFPDKAVVYSAGGNSWTTFMAGASLCNLPAGLPEGFLKTAAQVDVIPDISHWVLGKKGIGYIAYGQREIEIDLTEDGQTYQAQWLDTRSGQPVGEPFRVKGKHVFKAESQGVLWLYR
ncbi:MAG: pectate lyase [Bacteroidales bacterium]|nr:pectate lyase [Bacteroidales bacterium]